MSDRRFDEFLRRGGESPQFQDLPLESKFNPYHDPDDGRFTFGPGGGTLAPRERRAESPGMASWVKVPTPGQRRVVRGPQPSPTPTPPPKPADHGALSARYETRAGGDLGRVSTGRNDSGGVSYGTHQLSTNSGTVAAFLSSPEGARWSRDFVGLKPGSPEFGAKWQAVAGREPRTFDTAQASFVNRTHYRAAANSIAKRTGLNLEQRSEALRQVAFSTAVQHGPSGGPAVVAVAASRTDKRVARTDPQYDAALISDIYEVRIEHFLRKSREYAAVKLYEKAKLYRGIATVRLPAERVEALRLLPKKKEAV